MKLQDLEFPDFSANPLVGSIQVGKFAVDVWARYFFGTLFAMAYLVLVLYAIVVVFGLLLALLLALR